MKLGHIQPGSCHHFPRMRRWRLKRSIHCLTNICSLFRAALHFQLPSCGGDTLKLLHTAACQVLVCVFFFPPVSEVSIQLFGTWTFLSWCLTSAICDFRRLPCGWLCMAVECLCSSGVKQIINSENEPLKSQLGGDA